MIRKDLGVRISHSIYVPSSVLVKYSHDLHMNMDECMESYPSNIEIVNARKLLQSESSMAILDFNLSKFSDNQLKEKCQQLNCTDQEYIIACIEARYGQ